MSNQELGRVPLMNTWRDACESQQQKLNLILKDYSSKISVKYFTHDWFVKENYWVIRELLCNSKLVAILINCREVSITCSHL
jgi:hypothetical protein